MLHIYSLTLHVINANDHWKKKKNLELLLPFFLFFFLGGHYDMPSCGFLDTKKFPWNGKAEAHLEPSPTSVMELFGESS